MLRCLGWWNVDGYVVWCMDISLGLGKFVVPRLLTSPWRCEVGVSRKLCSDVGFDNPIIPFWKLRATGLEQQLPRPWCFVELCWERIRRFSKLSKLAQKVTSDCKARASLEYGTESLGGDARCTEGPYLAILLVLAEDSEDQSSLINREFSESWLIRQQIGTVLILLVSNSSKYIAKCQPFLR